MKQTDDLFGGSTSLLGLQIKAKMTGRLPYSIAGGDLTLSCSICWLGSVRWIATLFDSTSPAPETVPLLSHTAWLAKYAAVTKAPVGKVEI